MGCIMEVRINETISVLEDLRIDAVAAERVATFDQEKAITHTDMLVRFGANAQAQVEK